MQSLVSQVLYPSERLRPYVDHYPSRTVRSSRLAAKERTLSVTHPITQ